MKEEEFYSQYMTKHMAKHSKLGYSIQWLNRYAEAEERAEKAWKAYKKLKPKSTLTKETTKLISDYA